MKAKFINEVSREEDEAANKAIDKHQSGGMEVCPVCKGSGIQTITVSYWGSDEPDEESKMSCVGCNGEGRVDEETYEDLIYEQNMWCECGNPSRQSKFYKDGEHPIVRKHHYRCKDCGNVTQIG